MVQDVKRRRRQPSYSRKHWERVIEQWRASGLSKKGYCQQHGITGSVFTRWYKQIEGGKTAGAEESSPKGQEAFIPVYVREEPLGAQGCQIEIVLAQGHRMSVQGAIEWEALGAFLAPLLRRT